MTNIDVKIRNPYNNCILRKIIYHQYLPMLIGISDLLGAQTDRLRYEVCQNLIVSPMNTGILRPAVATVLTVYGIETVCLGQLHRSCPQSVATVLTVYGIETTSRNRVIEYHSQVSTIPTVYGMRRRVRDSRGAERR